MVKTDKRVTAEFLSSCQVTYDGSAYAPVTHKEVIVTVGDYIAECKLKIINEKYLAGSNGQKAIGVLGIESTDIDLNFMVAWKNSLDGSMAFKLAFGAQVRVCGNGMMHGDTGNFRKKHIGEAKEEITTHIKYAIDQMNPAMDSQTAIRDLYKQIPLSKKYAAELCGRLFIEHEALTPNQLNVVKREIEKATFNYGAPGTVWELYNHCTYAIRDSHPTDWHVQHQKIGDFFAKEFNI